jgi:hypothetical protein
MLDYLTAEDLWPKDVRMVINRDSTLIPWSARASTRTIGEGVAALLLRRGRLGSPPA